MTKLSADLRHRRLQAVAIAAVLFLATGAGTLALDTLVESQSPFEHAFAAANGAHLVVDFDPATSTAGLAATSHASGVTEAAGPWPVGVLGIGIHGKAGGSIFSPFPVSARPDPNTTVDRVTVSDGRWWQRTGEIVVAQRWAAEFDVRVGDSIEARQAPASAKPGPGGNVTVRPATGGPAAGGSATDLPSRSLRVVGIAGSVSTPDVFGWLSPADLGALSPGQPLAEQMLYRVAPSATQADLASALQSLIHGLPSSAVTSTVTYLALQEAGDRTAAIYVPLLLAFSLFALLAAAFIVANVVSGIVLADYRAIGVMKSIGYSPSQVERVLLGEVLLPASLGAVAGVTIGTIASQPILAQLALAFGLPSAFTLSGPVVTVVLGAALATTALAAMGPAIAAGRLSAVTAMTRGTAPSEPHGLRGRALRLPLRPAARLGIAGSVAHRLRAAMTLGALVVGVAAVVFSVGLVGSLRVVAGDLIRDQASPIRVELADPQLAPAAVSAAIANDPGTGRSVAIGDAQVSVPLLGSIPFAGYRGDSSWLGYALIRGRWFEAPGEAVAPTNFFSQSGLQVGDRVTIANGGRTTTVTLVGEILDQARENRDDLVLRGEWADLARIVPDLQPDRWELRPMAGVDPAAYRQRLSDATGPGVSWDMVSDSATDQGFLLFESVIGLLGTVLVVVSLGGVLDTALLETRRRSRETAVLKTLGMPPRDVMVMVISSVVPLGLAAGLLGVAVGLISQREILSLMGQAALRTDIPPSVFDVFTPATLVLLGLSGVALAAIGALIPAQRAARAPIVTVLASE